MDGWLCIGHRQAPDDVTDRFVPEQVIRAQRDPGSIGRDLRGELVLIGEIELQLTNAGSSSFAPSALAMTSTVSPGSGFAIFMRFCSSASGSGRSEKPTVNGKAFLRVACPETLMRGCATNGAGVRRAPSGHAARDDDGR